MELKIFLLRNILWSFEIIRGDCQVLKKTDIFGLKKQIKFKQFNFTYSNLVVFFQGGEEFWKVFMIQSMLAFQFSLLCFISLKIKKGKYYILNLLFWLTRIHSCVFYTRCKEHNELWHTYSKFYQFSGQWFCQGRYKEVLTTRMGT